LRRYRSLPLCIIQVPSNPKNYRWTGHTSLYHRVRRTCGQLSRGYTFVQDVLGKVPGYDYHLQLETAPTL
ncbi:MAG: hypothetical protein WCA38_13825, partial [Candidatus Acidiferrales bacterium]